MYIVTAEQMQALDRETIHEVGIPGMVLMENAGRGTVDHMERKWGPVSGKQVIVLVGPGNNGGDGLVIARTVLNRGGQPHIVYLFPPEKLGGDAGSNVRIVGQIGIAFSVIDPQDGAEKNQSLLEKLSAAPGLHSVVDAIFGIGLSRDVSGHFLQIIDTINMLRVQYSLNVVSVDIPSGLDSNTGEIYGGSIMADLTVTYGFPKPVHFHHGGRGVGEVAVVDIGIPSLLSDKMNLSGSALTKQILHLLPKREPADHKGSNGHLFILAGSAGKTGAAILTARGALRCGSGLVTLAVPYALNTIYETSLVEAMTIPLAHSRHFFVPDDYNQIVEAIQGKNVVVIGPGLGTEPETENLVIQLYQTCPLPMVVDADALNILARHQDILLCPGGPRILTPHPGEMARLLQITSQEVQRDRLAASLWVHLLNKELTYPVITVLKGAGTLVASSNGKWCINTTGNPGMGTGGMGDVLAGIIGGFLAQGCSVWDASCLGVYLHGCCGDLLFRDTPYGFSASEVAEMLPRSMSFDKF